MGKGFSFASVVLSYFMVAGGLMIGLLLAALLKIDSEYVGYALFAVGSFIGGFFAARASRGSTIIEPAIGAILVVATLAATIAATPFGAIIWHANPDAVTKGIIGVAAATLVGGIAGAFLSEKLFRDATTSSVPWIIYSALATFGAGGLAVCVASIVLFRGASDSSDTMAKVFLGGTAIGCLLSGIAIGVSARIAPRIAAFVGGALGVGALCYLAIQGAGSKADSETITGMIVITVGGAIVTLIGAAIGWAAIGKNRADA